MILGAWGGCLLVVRGGVAGTESPDHLGQAWGGDSSRRLRLLVFIGRGTRDVYFSSSFPGITFLYIHKFNFNSFFSS